MKETKHIIQCVGNRQFRVSKQADGNILFQIAMGNTGEVIANPILTPIEAEKLKNALSELELE